MQLTTPDSPNRATRAVVFALASALSLLIGSMVQAATTPIKLVGEVGPGFTITLKKGTAKVSTLKAGSYAITVKDRSTSHNFHLFGTGVNKATAVATTSTVTWTVTLRAGTYTYQCDPHSNSGMKATFKVTK